MSLSKGLWKKELQEIRVILIGKTGAGKSFTGNALLGRDLFETSVIATAVTDSCAFGKQEVTSSFRKYILKVVDTPGLKDNRLPEAETCGELIKCLSLALPGPHLFVIVVQIGRFTEEELDVVEMLKKEFGNEFMHFALVVFTHGSKLKGMSIETYMQKAPTTLKQVVRECRNRYEVLYDDDKNLQESVQNIIDLIVNSADIEDYYTNAMFKQASENKKMIIAKIEEERNREINALKEEMKELRRKGYWSKEEIKRKEERLMMKETTSSEEMYDTNVNLFAGATFGKIALTAAIVTGCVAVLFAGGAVVLAVGTTSVEIGGATVYVGNMIATGLAALARPSIGYVISKLS